MRIVIRTDASVKIGTGHVHRTAALAQELKAAAPGSCLSAVRKREI